jgi:hypothetical protein
MQSQKNRTKKTFHNLSALQRASTDLIERGKW